MGTSTTTSTAAAVGLDVSKDTLDCCRLAADGTARQKVFPNTPAGFAALVAWADRPAGGRPLHFACEATGPYSHGVAALLHAAGRTVSVVNPTRIEHAGLMRGRGNKTDKADAKLIAEYALRECPPAWSPPPPDVQELQALTRRADDLTALAAREKGQLASPALAGAARASVARAVRFLEREAGKVRAAADAVVAGSGRLADDRRLLESIPGVGRQTATTLLAELPAVDRLPSAQSAAAYCGLAPREFRSGTSVRRRTRLSKAGNARLRKALFLPTQTAVRFNPILRGFFVRLTDPTRKGGPKPKMQAVGACMRKLVMLCYGVLKNRAPFDPNWASRIPT